MVTEDTPSVSVAVGITVGLIASLVQSLGLTIQRKSHILNDELPEGERKAEHRRPLWLLGFTIFISSNILGSIFQIAALPVVILAPLGAVSLLWNAFFARLLLGNVFSHYMFIGTLLIATGAVLIAIFGIVPEPTHSLDDLLRLFGRHIFIVYFALLGFAVLCVLVATHLAEYRLPTGAISVPGSPTLTPVPESPTEQIFPTERTPLLDNKLDGSLEIDAQIRRTRTWIAVSYASISGILSGMCLIFAKSGVELLVLTVGGQNQFWRWESWALVGGLIAFALLQMWYLHKSLVLADPTLVCPLAFCFYNLSSILNGLVYYDQFAALSVTHLLLVTLGIAILLGGVWAVSIQSGGSRVEVGTWQEGAEVLTAEALNIPSVAISPVMVPPSPQSPTRPRWPPNIRRGRAFTDDPTRLEEVDEVPPLQQQEPGQMLTHFPSSPSTSTSPTQLVSPPSPTRNRRSSLRKWTGLLTVDHDGRSSVSGLTIGIGATSPGFAIVPTRRRRVSQESVEVWRRASRRTVSESDVPGIGGLGIVSVHSLIEEGQAQQAAREREEEATRPPAPMQRLVSAIRRVFRR